MSGTIRNIAVTGIVLHGGTAGTVQLQWAQNASNGTATVVETNCFLVVKKF